jgi:D-aminopeptidase
MIPNNDMDPLFEATVQATEEAILNALCAARKVKGYQSHGLRHHRSAAALDRSFAVAGRDAQEV